MRVELRKRRSTSGPFIRRLLRDRYLRSLGHSDRGGHGGLVQRIDRDMRQPRGGSS